MKTITIEDKEYDVITTFDDLTFGDWIVLTDIIARREYKDIELASGEILKEELEREKESDEFKEEKRIDLLHHLSLVPKELLTEYPSLPDIIESLISWDNLFDDPTVQLEKISVYGRNYELLRPSQTTFQRWCDAENFRSINTAAFLIPYLDDSTPYNRFYPDFNERLEQLLGWKAEGLVFAFNSIAAEMHEIRDSYKFVYSNEESDSEVGINTQEHFQRFNWEDVTISVAESQVFNSPKGTLYAVRNESVLEVLDYLNVKRSRDLATYKDEKKRQSKDSNFKTLN